MGCDRVLKKFRGVEAWVGEKFSNFDGDRTDSGSHRGGGDNALREQMLRVLPQADLNQDGKISESEESRVRRQALKRFPQLDRDSDGKTPDTEMKAMLRSAAQRAARNQPRTEKTGSDASPKAMEAKLRDEMGLVVEKDIAYRTDTGQPTNRLDFIHPKRRVYERAPLLVYIHGGGNTGGSRMSFTTKVIGSLRSSPVGGTIASIDYRLLGKDEGGWVSSVVSGLQGCFAVSGPKLRSIQD